MKVGIDARFAIRQPRRGIGTYSINLLRELVQIDRDVYFVLYTDREDTESVLPSGPNVSVKCLWPRNYTLWEQMAFPLAVMRDDLDLLHTLGNTAPLWLLGRTRLVLTLHDVMFLQSNEFVPKPTTNYQRAGRLYRSFVVPLNTRHADSVITISNFSRQDIINLIRNLDCENVIPIYEACDPVFSNTPVLPQKLIGRPYFLCLGAEDPRKNTKRIVNGYIEAIRNNDIKEDLVIVGYSNWSGCPAHQLVKNAGAEGRVHFLSFISLDELVALYQHATGLLYLSLYEGFGIPILEAYSCGCPVIASNTTSIPEVGGDAAIFIDPTDTHAIGDSIARLCKDPGLQSDLRRRGLERAKLFSWKYTAIKTLEVYRKVLRNSKDVNS